MATARLSSDELALALVPVTGHLFRDTLQLQRALTHASARTANAGADYQRFEFLGDRVLGLVVAEMLFTAYPDAPEGELSVRLNALVNADALAAIADEIGLPRMIRAGAELRTVTGRKRINLRADALEALIAALYLDGGMPAASAFIERYWKPRATNADAMRRDPKTELQEWAHKSAQATPSYEILGREGPDHDPVFTVKVCVAQIDPAVGSGGSKREAEQEAATAMLVREGVWQAKNGAGDNE
jgi:ribonuclease-3